MSDYLRTKWLWVWVLLQSLKNWASWKKQQILNELVTDTVFYIKVGKIENKTPNIRRLVTNTPFNTKIEEVERKFLIMLNILPCFGKFPGETFNAKLKKIKNKKIGTNTDLANFEKTE